MSLAEQARAFRTSTDEQYADLVNGRITAEQLIAANIDKKPRYYAHGRSVPRGHSWPFVDPQGNVPTVMDRDTGTHVAHVATPELADRIANALNRGIL